PDSSRFWPKERWHPGRKQKDFDKQVVRDYLDSLDWDKTPPGPSLPANIVELARERYLEAYRRIIGKSPEV
ncbi:phosphoribosylaminoimidazolesuccinocarboxamide synthase, partial [Candidatus Calescamantes bacterium]|nr:phosphoribosylaminoimidazolesuccinocarboxamide synthase [Candidatus Calescamantes bacterium]